MSWDEETARRLEEQCAREEAKRKRGEWCSGVAVSPADIRAALERIRELEGQLEQANDALITAREAAGPNDRPFLDDAVALLRQRAEAAEARVNELEQA